MSDILPFVIVGLTRGSIYGLAGTGLVLTYKTSGIFNFAHGTTAALMAYAFYDLRERQGLPWPVAALLCVFVLAPLTGVLLERMARRVADAPVVMKVVATVGIVVGVQQLIVLRYGASYTRMQPFLPTGSFRFAGVNIGWDQVVVMAIAIAGTVGLSRLLSGSRLGREMQAVVDQPDLLALTGTTPAHVRRAAWMTGTGFAAISGILLAQAAGLEPTILTLLVVQAFGAAAVGGFRSIPLTYAGAIGIGVLASVSTKFVATMPTLNGIPASLPFLVLFAVLVVAPNEFLASFGTEPRPKVKQRIEIPSRVKWGGGILLAAFVLRLPYLVGFRLPVYTAALAFVIIFLSLLLLMRMSGQVSLAQLAFAAVGAAASSRLAVEAGLPWLLAVLLGAGIAVPVGALLAVPAIRRSGLYLALATFGFAVLLEQLVFPTDLMFGASAGSLPAPRPEFASGDRAYFYVVLAFVVASVILVVVIQRSRLGRLLRAMSDSPTALTTYGTSLTGLKVTIFCIASFLAGLGGALLGPVTGSASQANFLSFGSLVLVVVSVIVIGSEVPAAIGAAFAHVVIPSYVSEWVTDAHVGELLPMLFGVGAVAAAMQSSHTRASSSGSGRLRKALELARPEPHRNPMRSRVPRAVELESA